MVIVPLPSSSSEARKSPNSYAFHAECFYLKVLSELIQSMAIKIGKMLWERRKVSINIKIANHMVKSWLHGRNLRNENSPVKNRTGGGRVHPMRHGSKQYLLLSSIVMNGQPLRGDTENTKFESPNFGGWLVSEYVFPLAIQS